MDMHMDMDKDKDKDLDMDLDMDNLAQDQLDLLDDIIFRYRRHLRILKVLNSAGDDCTEESCVPREELDLWEAQIHHEFQTRLKDAVVRCDGKRNICKLWRGCVKSVRGKVCGNGVDFMKNWILTFFLFWVRSRTYWLRGL